MPPKRARKRKRRQVSISSSSSDSSSDDEASKNAPAPLTVKFTTATVTTAHPPAPPSQSSSASSSSDDSSSSDSDSDEEKDGDETMEPVESTSPINSTPARAIHLPSRSPTPSRTDREWSRSPTPPPREIPSILPETTQIHASDSSTGGPPPDQDLRDRFRKFWMASVADAFQGDLEKLRQEPGMNTNRLSLLIDSLASGSEVYKDPKDLDTIMGTQAQ